MSALPGPAAPGCRHGRAVGATLLLLAALLGTGCGSDGAAPAGAGHAPYNPFRGYRSAVYGDDARWLCRPDLPGDRCAGNLDATEVLPDGTLRPVSHVPAAVPRATCFYVYPTVNLSVVPGNDTDFTDVRRKLDPLLSQAARFTRVCRVFAPLYRQMTLGALGTPGTEALFEIAWGDVHDAFRHVLGQYDDGAPLVLIGHSQGTAMLTRLLQEEFETSRLRERLAVALLVGGGGLHVPRGAAAGGTFRHIPLCRSATETGCVIAYNAFAAEAPPPPDGGIAGGLPPGMETACTNPGALAGGPARYRGSYFPTFAFQPLFRIAVGPPGIPTPFVLYRDYFAGECVSRPDGVRYLRIEAQPDPGDRRTPGSLRNPAFESLGLGLHLVDFHLALDDLITLVERQVEVMARQE